MENNVCGSNGSQRAGYLDGNIERMQIPNSKDESLWFYLSRKCLFPWQAELKGLNRAAEEISRSFATLLSRACASSALPPWLWALQLMLP